MSLTIISPGIDTSFSTKLNSNFSQCLTQNGLNTIRQLIDRSIIFSSGMIDGWGEAYIDSNGRLNSVTGSTTCVYDSTNLKYFVGLGTDQASGDSTYNPNSFTNPSYAYDSNDGTQATYSQSGPISSGVILGKTFGAKTVSLVRIKSTAHASGGSNGCSVTFYLSTYNGSIWTDVATLATTSVAGDNQTDLSIDTYYVLNSSVQGIGVKIVTTASGTSQTNTAGVYTLSYGDADTSGKVIVHTIPTGTFNSTISKVIGVPMIANWETGADIQFKLTNGSEDSGWLTCGTTPSIQSFTAFTSEPTTLTVKLIPKSSSPTGGYPSLYGFWIRAT